MELCFGNTIFTSFVLLCCFTGSRNGVVVDVYRNIWSLMVLKIEESIVRQLCAGGYKKHLKMNFVVFNVFCSAN